MRLTIPATLVALGCLAFHAFGCAGGTDETTSGGGQGGSGGAAAGGNGGAGGATCTPTDETCDSFDNDCDEEVDEGCPCVQGQTQPCYSGAQGTLGFGPCVAGQQACDETGAWGKCVGEVVPKVQEICNGIDDECNGVVDDMGLTACGVGACRVEVVTCENGALSMCNPLPPAQEQCDGLDNDCDQLVDESFPDKGKVCETGLFGACSKGKFSCKDNEKVCVPDTASIPETCNGADDDCDGVVDENIPGTGGSCGTGMLGVCAAGMIQCNGTTIGCFPVVAISSETCNGLDDDCDGTVDENNPQGGGPCNTGQSGFCSAGTLKCQNAALVCESNLSNAAEKCNGLDDDCDGTVDEGNPGGGVACACLGTTACSGGELRCQTIPGGPTIFLFEDFDDAANWTLGPEWEIKPAAGGSCANPGGAQLDPTNDTSPSTDNRIAGVIVGGCSTSSQAGTPHGYYYLTSPIIDTAASPAVYLQFQRWLNSDITPFMNNVIEVFNGTSWVQVWQSGATPSLANAWTKVYYDLTPHKNANMRLRWGFNVISSVVDPVGSWNIDDVTVSTTICP